MTVSLRLITEADLALIEAWLHEPHVATWWLTTTTVEDELADIRAALGADQEFEVLIVECEGRPVGWCQWYRWWDDPEQAAEIGAQHGDLGLDYAIGDAQFIGRGVGTQMMAELVRYVRARAPGRDIVVEPDAANVASRRILERNGFRLVDERSLSFEKEELNAIYRLPVA